MGLLTGVWTWLTRHVLADTRLGTANGYVVVDVESERARRDAIHLLADGNTWDDRIRWIADTNEHDWIVIRNDPAADEQEVIHAIAGTDGDAKALADRLDLPAFRSPVDALHELEDAPDRIYAWEVESEARARSLLDALDAHGVEDMDALHVVLTDKEELARLTHDEIRTYVDAGVEA